MCKFLYIVYISQFRRLGAQLRRPGAYWRKNCRCYLRCTILPRLNSSVVSSMVSSTVNRLGLAAVYFAIGSTKQPNFENWRYFRKNAVFELIFSQKAASAAAGWPSGSQNKYFCRPHHLKEAKIIISSSILYFYNTDEQVRTLLTIKIQ